MTHKSEDYKISAVKYYLKNKDNIRKTCKIFDCKKSTLQRWIQRYNSTKNLTRRNRKNTFTKQVFLRTRFSNLGKIELLFRNF
jgi:transposase-like protein